MVSVKVTAKSFISGGVVRHPMSVRVNTLFHLLVWDARVAWTPSRPITTGLAGKVKDHA